LLSPETSVRGPLTTALMRKERDGARGVNFSSLVAEGAGWRVLDIVCTAGPRDRPFEERHAWTSISMVMAGTFAYRSDRGSSLMSPGALLLGSIGRSFECSHSHGEGDRCLSFQFDQDLFENLARDAGASGATLSHDRIPPLRSLAPLTARVFAGLDRPATFEEVGLELAGAVIHWDSDRDPSASAPRDRPSIAGVIRHLEACIDQPHTLAELASIAGLSRYHFLRTFKRVTGATPHQWILRARLREAARRIASSSQPITEIALDVGFEDLSNFIRGFRAEFGISPQRYRAARA
jgi:AraC family transcriptional regulator